MCMDPVPSLKAESDIRACEEEEVSWRNVGKELFYTNEIKSGYFMRSGFQVEFVTGPLGPRKMRAPGPIPR